MAERKQIQYATMSIERVAKYIVPRRERHREQKIDRVLLLDRMLTDADPNMEQALTFDKIDGMVKKEKTRRKRLENKAKKVKPNH